MKWVAVETYFIDANIAAQDALDGNNPFVSKEYARWYKKESGKSVEERLKAIHNARG